MRFLADENFPLAAVSALARAGHDIVWVRTAHAGISDVEVLDWVARESRILLTFDKDFGELARGSSLAVEGGIILFRLSMPRAVEAGERLAKIITARLDWAGHFSVVEPNRIRMRPLQSPQRTPTSKD
jgi:hypothetical protein